MRINRTSGLFLRFIFLSLMVLALSGLIHLSLVIINNTGGNANRYSLALISAFGNGLIIVASIAVVQRFLAQTQAMIWKYVTLIGCICFLNYWMNYGLFYLLAKRLLGSPDGNGQFALSDLFYAVNPLIVGVFFLYYLTREQNRTRKISEQEYQLLQLKELKTKAELEALQAKINPHFLYNSLNSIASLVHINPDKAEEMVILLSKFFRYSTSVKSQYFHTVGEEIEMVRTYLDVEKVRFDERLTYSIEYSVEELNEYLIPRFLLQPLVENAIKHGIAKVAAKGNIRLQITTEGTYMVILIQDNGPDFPQHISTSYGLQSTSDKLRMLCGEEASLEINNQPFKHIKIKTRLLKEPLPDHAANAILETQPR
jgi:two-component system LytT family sensor kinase